jgi:uncharacterized paraquat-inducible protein A
MTQHFTRNTVSAEFWCSKCKKFTQHRVDVRKGPCLECISRLESRHNLVPKVAAEKQSSLFDKA